MSVRIWFQPPRQLIAIFALMTLVPSVLLVAFGWRLLQQDRAIGLQQLQERREQAADLVVSSLEQRLTEVEKALRDPAAIESLVADHDGVAVVFTRERVQAFPRERLLYYPVASPGREAPAEVFETGETLEYRQADPRQAAAWYGTLARSTDAAVRAGALIRQARVFRRTAQHDRALAAYAQAAGVRNAAVGGVPVDLLARWARGDVLALANRREELTTEARELHRDLQKGHWEIDRAIWELHATDAARWSGLPTTSHGLDEEAALSTAVERLWNIWRILPAGVDGTVTGRDVVTSDDREVTVLWSGNRERVAALAAGPDYVARQWVGHVTPALDRQRLHLSLGDRAGRVAEPHETRRVAGDTGLPWTVVVRNTDWPSEVNRLADRRSLWLGGLAILVLLVVSGTAIVGRAVTRDLAVARLQSDFVSAVSHEFRTPLTSLRQLTEVLSDARVGSEDRRQTYYAALTRQTDRLHRLVESLLDFGRMEAGTSPYRLEPLDAYALIRAVVAQFNQEVESRGYHVELRLDDLSPQVEGDRDALTNALWNLLDNAVKYSPDCRTILVEADCDSKHFSIRVRDRGLGIPPAEQQDIFRKFVRGAEARLQGITGTGIGLAMVRHIVEAHRGTVLVESTPGEGSTFTVVLPVARSRKPDA
jgi:signal transduction histidine kinase